MGGLTTVAASSATAAPGAESVATCAYAWGKGEAYTGGKTVSHGGRNWTAKWWSYNDTPGGAAGVWKDAGECREFVVSEAQFEEMFPNRDPFFTYRGLVDALSAYPEFAGVGSDADRRREVAAFLGNINHETAGLKYIVEQNKANYPHYCDTDKEYGCPAGQDAYYGRGPIQLSWNFNYKEAGEALGLDLLKDPWMVERRADVAWMTALWYWNTQTGPGTMTAHEAMVGGHGFGETIRSINGTLECNGGNPRQVESRIASYTRFAAILGTTPGDNLSC
ncbi:chitinase [Streptomyces sp. SHP 1-2]|nr:glycoside hydrolase family 19 protein [Streptomyces sp. SHP 1-2]MCW5249534.1 chitinase [Streptomyces sp. SHP 1-2]